MRPLIFNAVLIALAALAGFAWALIYPFPWRGNVNDTLWLVVALGFFGLFSFSRGIVRSIAILIACVSVISGFITLLWSAESWGSGVWYPEFPPILHRIFSADGEAAYNASDAQLFVVLFMVLLIVAVSTPWVRSVLKHSAQRTRRGNDNDT